MVHVQVCFNKSFVALAWDTKLYGDQDDETIGCSCSCPLFGDLTSSACVCGCMVNGLSTMAVTYVTVFFLLYYARCKLFGLRTIIRSYI